MTQITVPRWAPLFWGVEGALSVLVFDGVLNRALGHGASALALVPFMLGVIWWARYRRRQ